MSTTHPLDQVEYPESDGRPMGETDHHRDWMIRILDILRHRYRGQRVYVASNLLVYYEEGAPKRFIVPDDFIVLNCDPGQRRVFKIWEEKRTPDVVIEVTSRQTRREDRVKKPAIYERMGVKEYFLFDPTESYLQPALLGFRLIDGSMQPITYGEEALTCQTLGIYLKLSGKKLEMFDSQTHAPLLPEVEAERAARLAAEDRVRELEAEIERLKRDP